MRTVLVALAAGGLLAGAIYLKGGADAGARREIAALRAAAAESERRNRVIDAARKEAERMADAIAAERAAHTRLKEEIDRASRAHDGRVCLDAGGVQRLDRIGGPPPAAPRRPAR
ncbi:MAG TPA: hypothetical protein VM434_05035 [Beijerinckiaceae bacterium]|nr:hypothetical protein [Beijerinckiaceae bacterium]